jgi:hypothetical protein
MTKNYIDEFNFLQNNDMDYEIYISRMRGLSKEIENYLEWNFSYDEYQSDEYCELYDICLKAYKIGKALI